MLALLLIGGGTLWLLAGLDVFTVDAEDALALGLLVVGAGLLVTSWRGRGYALIPVGFLLAGTLVAIEVIDVPLRAGTGERTVVVDTASDLRTRHELLAGELTVDITDAPLPAGRTTEVAAAVGMGELNVVVPRGVVVDVNATTGAGEVTSPGGPEANETGMWVDTTFTLDAEAADTNADTAETGAAAAPDAPEGAAGADPPRLILDLDVGVGAIEVTRG